MPSLTAIVTNSIGYPPAARTPSLASLASRSRVMLQGVTSFHDDATPIWDLSQSSSVMPTARSIARAGARSNPSVTSNDRGFMVCSVGPLLMGAEVTLSPAMSDHSISDGATAVADLVVQGTDIAKHWG